MVFCAVRNTRSKSALLNHEVHSLLTSARLERRSKMPIGLLHATINFNSQNIELCLLIVCMCVCVCVRHQLFLKDIFIDFIVWFPFPNKNNQFQQWFLVSLASKQFGKSCWLWPDNPFWLYSEGARKSISARSLQSSAAHFIWIEATFDWAIIWLWGVGACELICIRFFLATANIFIFSMLSISFEIQFKCSFSLFRLIALYYTTMLNNKQRINKISKQENRAAILYKCLPRCLRYCLFEDFSWERDKSDTEKKIRIDVGVHGTEAISVSRAVSCCVG